jgi:hypothetical protein
MCVPGFARQPALRNCQSAAVPSATALTIAGRPSPSHSCVRERASRQAPPRGVASMFQCKMLCKPHPPHLLHRKATLAHKLARFMERSARMELQPCRLRRRNFLGDHGMSSTETKTSSALSRRAKPVKKKTRSFRELKCFGLWADRTDVENPVEFTKQLRSRMENANDSR